jgi:hypothetical protein
MITVIRVGHPSYTGVNRYAVHKSYRSALIDLLGRRVSMAHAHKALRSALKGSHASCSVFSRSNPRVALSTVEVTSAIVCA